MREFIKRGIIFSLYVALAMTRNIDKRSEIISIEKNNINHESTQLTEEHGELSEASSKKLLLWIIIIPMSIGISVWIFDSCSNVTISMLWCIFLAPIIAIHYIIKQIKIIIISCITLGPKIYKTGEATIRVYKEGSDSIRIKDIKQSEIVDE